MSRQEASCTLGTEIRLTWPTFSTELRDFIGFIKQPGLRRLPGRTARKGWLEDWFAPLDFARLLKWAGLLWLVNMMVLGPIAVAAAGAGGAEHRLRLDALPWLQALIWAPIVEELVFRYWLRIPGHALWLVPVSLVALLSGPQWWSVILVGMTVLLCWWPYLFGPGISPRPLPWRIRKLYRRYFGVIVHLSCLLFAAVHLGNFSYNETPLWLLPFLVLPQWVTGLALAWLRVRRGIGAAIALHAIFNGGPLLVIWLIISWLPTQ
jgi:membrane protease YdiL (CAAX protease family)